MDSMLQLSLLAYTRRVHFAWPPAQLPQPKAYQITQRAEVVGTSGATKCTSWSAWEGPCTQSLHHLFEDFYDVHVPAAVHMAVAVTTLG
jgi:hypothetical protein